jgi:NAD(P)-dependent dehydrogenase (short-subunit alcohol dehydrogenase family)
MRKQKSGIVVNISSGAGRFGFPEGLLMLAQNLHELEPFGIKVVIVEPRVIRTNFGNGLVIAKKSQDPNSPYSYMMQKMASGFEKLMKNSSSADVVAKVVLDAVRDENPNLRYLAGKNVEQWLGSKRNMSDEEFYKIMKQNLMM